MDFAIKPASQDPRLCISNYYNAPPPPILVPNQLPLGLSSNTTARVFDLSVPTPISLDTKTDDELWVETWLSKIGKINLDLTSDLIENNASVKTFKTDKPIKKPNLSIHTAKENLQKCSEITHRLEETQNILTQNLATMSTEEWKQHTCVIGMLKDELTILMSQFQSPEVLKSLKYEITQRAKKRRCQKHRRVEKKLQRLENKKRNLEQHKKIDLWLAAKKEDSERAKAEENMKKDADCVLSEVTKKNSEARKNLSLIASLIKLRNVREIEAKARGEKIPLEDNVAFCKTTETLITLWENSCKTYSIEEQGLKLMLEQNASKDTKLLMANKEKEVAQQWDYVLFGPSHVPSHLYWALTAAQRDMEKFIALRRSWDTFRNNQEGSKIPIGWVIPEANPSLEWSQYKHFL